MSIYRFLGTECLIGDRRKLQQFGQSIELPDDVAHELILGAGPEQGFAGASLLLPDEDFKIAFDGMTDREIMHFGVPANQFGDQASGFRDRKKAALEALDELRTSLVKGETHG